MKTSALLLVVSLVASPAMFAGEYGLSVDPSFPHPCKRKVSRSLNYCTAAAVVQDFRGYFISGKGFRIKAVEMAVVMGKISLSADALVTFNEGHRRHLAVRLSDVDIQAEIDLWERVKGPMPYPTPGTACALFGFQDAAHAALDERRRKRVR